MSLWGVTAVSSMESLLGDCSSTYCKRASAPGPLNPLAHEKYPALRTNRKGRGWRGLLSPRLEASNGEGLASERISESHFQALMSRICWLLLFYHSARPCPVYSI